MPLLVGLCLIASAFLYACRTGNHSPAGETIVFPPQLAALHSADSTQQNKIFIKAPELTCNKQLKLVIVTDGNCGACFMELVQWQEYLQQYRKEYESVYPAVIMRAENVFLAQYYLEQISISLPVYLDTEDLFTQSNYIERDMSYTFLLNPHNLIIHSGSPLKEKKNHRQMIRQIKKYNRLN